MLAAWTLATFAAEQCTQLRNTSYVHTDLGAAQLRPRLPQGTTVNDFTLPLEEVTPDRARAIFDEFGVLVVRDLAAAYAPRIRAAAEAAFARSLALLEAGHFEAVINGDHTVGWSTPDQTLFIPAPEGHARSKQAMVLALDYFSDASMLQAATDERTLDIVEALLGSPNIELFGKGQCFYKEGMTGASSPGGIDAAMMGRSAMADTSMSSGLRPGGNPKYLHQDSAYFMFGRGGAVATLSYAVDTSARRDNGPLFVVPGSHAFGHLQHVDTPSHLGVGGEWSFDDAVRIDGAAGDTVFFHVHTLHGSSPNRSPAPRPSFINRYIDAEDYQAFFATDARMREHNRREYEEGVRNGVLPVKERGVMVRGAREWRENGPGWKLDLRVNH